MKRILYLGGILILLLTLLNACSTEQEGLETSGQTYKPTLETLEGMGFDITDAVELRDHFMVEGDVIIAKEYLENERPWTRQYASQFQISRNNVETIKLKYFTEWIQVPSQNRSMWQNAISDAVDIYNSTENTSIYIESGSYSSGYEYEDNTIVIYAMSDVRGMPPLYDEDGEIDRSVIAYAEFPTTKVGRFVVVNVGDHNGLSHEQKVWNMVHEIGHCLGLRHTNWRSLGEALEGARKIEGTPDTDNKSVMNGASGNSRWTVFSPHDLTALEWLYPIRYSTEITGPDVATQGASIDFSIDHCFPLKYSSYTWSITGDVEVSSRINRRNGGVLLTCHTPGTLRLEANIQYKNGETRRLTKSVQIVPLDITGPSECFAGDTLVFEHNQEFLEFCRPTWSVSSDDIDEGDIRILSSGNKLELVCASPGNLTVDLQMWNGLGEDYYDVSKEVVVKRTAIVENEIRLNIGDSVIRNIDGVDWVCIPISMESTLPIEGEVRASGVTLILPLDWSDFYVIGSNELEIIKEERQSNQDYIQLYPADQSHESSMVFIVFNKMTDKFKDINLYGWNPLFYSFPLYDEERISTTQFLNLQEIQNLMEEKGMPWEYLPI